MKIIIGTRGSALALWQARYVASFIAESHPDANVELMTIKTRGDKILDTPLAQIGGKGLFTKEIEEALLDGRVDLAVHSMKDLPTDLPAGLKLAAIMEREDPRDAFVSRDGRGLEKLEPGAVVGTSSLRRKAFLLSLFSSLRIVSLRGNLDTRLRKLHTDNLDAVILAAAGIKRMGLADRITRLMDPDMMIPAIGQGALGIETRVENPRIEEIVSPLNHEETALCVNVERAFLKRMGGGCQVPMAAYASLDGDKIRLTAAIVHPDGKPLIRDTVTSSRADSEIGTQLADILTERGGAQIMRSVLGQDWKPGPG